MRQEDNSRKRNGAFLVTLFVAGLFAVSACANYGPTALEGGRGTVITTAGGPMSSISSGFRGPPDPATAHRSVTDNGVIVLTHPGQCKFSIVHDGNWIQFLNATIIIDAKEYVSPTFVYDQPGLKPETQAFLARNIWLLDSSSSNYCAPAPTSRELSSTEKFYDEYKLEAAQKISLAMIEYAVRAKQIATEEGATQLFSEVNERGVYIDDWRRASINAIIAEGKGQTPPPAVERFVWPVTLQSD